MKQKQTVFMENNKRITTAHLSNAPNEEGYMSEKNQDPITQQKPIPIKVESPPIEQQARKEARKEVLIQEEMNKQKLEKLVSKSAEILLEIESVFPFTLFPDKVIITEEKVSVINRNFFYSESVKSVLGKDIAHVDVDTNIFFATLTIIDKYFTQDPIMVNHLHKGDALEARRIIQGMIVTSHQEIDITKIDAPDIRYKLEQIGRSTIS